MMILSPHCKQINRTKSEVQISTGNVRVLVLDFKLSITVIHIDTW